MKLIKLDAISSTNDFLKEIASHPETVNFTIVTAENQTKGKGQRGSKWDSEVGKNIIASILVKGLQEGYNHIFDLNVAVAISVFAALEKIEIPDLAIKWPNDIMSGNKKVGGILIENIIKSDGKIISIVGLGLNVNQVNFNHLPNASSLALIKNTEFDKQSLLLDIIETLMRFTSEWQKELILSLWEKYNKILFKRSIPVPFENIDGFQFMGIIQNVSPIGKLRVLHEDGSIKEFDVKEIRMLY